MTTPTPPGAAALTDTQRSDLILSARIEAEDRYTLRSSAQAFEAGAEFMLDIACEKFASRAGAPALTNDDFRRIARGVGMLASHDGMYMRSVGTHGGMSAEDGFAFARAVIAADRASRVGAEPFWYAVVSEKSPGVNKAIRRLDVAEAYADNCREQGYSGDIEVVPLYRAAPVAAAPAIPAAHQAAEPAPGAASPDVAKMVEEAKEILDETYRFAATSPRSQENINAVCELLDKIEAATIREVSDEAAQAIQNALKTWDGEAGVWIQRRTALAAIDALGAAATQASAAAPSEDTKRLDALQVWAEKSKSCGLTANGFVVDFAVPDKGNVRVQLDKLIAAAADQARKHS